MASPDVGRGVVLGCTASAVAFVLLGGLAGLAGYRHVKQQEAEVRRGWNLVPVVVAAHDLEPGTVIDLPMVARRMVPEQFATESVITPDQVSRVLKQPILVALRAGDPLLWSQFESGPRRCEVVLVLARAVPGGAVVTAEDLTELAFCDRPVGSSWVRASQRAEVTGLRTVVRLAPGDPLLWTGLESTRGDPPQE